MPYDIIFGAIIALSIAFFLMGRRFAEPPVQMEDQLGRYLAGEVDAVHPVIGDGLSRLSLLQRVILPTLNTALARLGSLTPQRGVDYLTARLDTAGRPYGLNVLNFYGLKLILAPVLALIGFQFNSLLLRREFVFGPLLALIFGIAGFYMPDLWLASVIATRKRAIVRALPDALDMVVVSVEAGQSFDHALKRVSARWRNPLTEEFNRIIAEIALGRTRREALSSASERIQLADMSNLIMAIIQADQLGVSIGKVLRTQADQLRTLRRQRAEELAREAAIKLLFPLVFLIFPAMFAVLLGPAVPLILDTFTRIGGR
jgi:tight adherence protein C